MDGRRRAERADARSDLRQALGAHGARARAARSARSGRAGGPDAVPDRRRVVRRRGGEAKDVRGSAARRRAPVAQEVSRSAPAHRRRDGRGPARRRRGDPLPHRGGFVVTCGHDVAAVDGQCPACLLALAVGGAELLPGTIIAGRFRIVAPVGRGGMGEVYHAEDMKLGHAVALKFVDASEATLREVRAGREIAHPNVCRLYDVVDVDDRAAIVMEFVDGEDLASLLGRVGRLSFDKAVEVARDVCNGLDAIHDKGIVHGDLKPANVMIDSRGRARITDFGLARRADEEAQFGGTPPYIAPEQFATRSATPMSDLYALGRVLSEVFAGGTRPEIHEVIEQCLRREPARRPASAREILAVLPGGDALTAMIAAGET